MWNQNKVRDQDVNHFVYKEINVLSHQMKLISSYKVKSAMWGIEEWKKVRLMSAAIKLEDTIYLFYYT